jgi:multiple sugar transport system substrate-binding protein
LRGGDLDLLQAFGARRFDFGFIAASCIVACCLGAGCSAREGAPRTVRFWAMGREGEVVQELLPEFRREHPDIRVEVQQLPWSAAHEKLLTAFVGRSTPDAAQLGNTWIAEFAALGAILPLDDRLAKSTALDSTRYFPGIWRTNLIDGACFGIPWYVDTRVLFYRKDLLAEAGFDSVPPDWSGWRRAMEAICARGGRDRYAILLPVNEWLPPVVLGLQAGSPLLADNATRGAFREPEFRRAFDFFLGLFRDGLAPPLSNNEIANLYQEFARGYFAMYITGPWNIGEFRRRLPPELQSSWGTAPLPGPEPGVPGVSTAGGASLVLFRGSRHPDDAWTFLEYLSRPDVQLRFRALTGDLPARTEAWEDSSLAGDAYIGAFRRQLLHVVPTPKTPEWELIATRIQERAELVIRGAAPAESALALLDRDAERILAKRRWMLSRRPAHATAAAGGAP